MIKKAIVFAAAAACLTSGAAFAQSYDRNGGHQRGVQSERYDRNGDGRVDREYRRDSNEYRRDSNTSAHRDYRDQRDYRGSRDGYRNDRNYRSSHVYVTPSRGHSSYYQMRRGQRLAQHYRSQRYVVSDWRGHRLYQPQRGYHWVQTGNDYALVAIATGIIAQVLLNH